MRKLAVGLVAMLVIVIPQTGEANKKAAGKSCPKKSFCVWSKPGYKGARQVISNTGVKNLNSKLDNEASSLKSTLSKQAFIYAKPNADGDYRCLPPGTKIPDLGITAFDFDNVASSVFVPKPGDTLPDC